jgi:hypothetical protein
MADLEITSLTAGTAKATDVFVAVDTTDTSMAITGTDKKYLRSANTAYDASIFFTTAATEILISAGAGVAPTGDAALTYAGAILTAPTALLKTGLRLEDPGAGTNYVLLQAGSLLGNSTYTLPVMLPAVDGYVLSSTALGVMSWVADNTGGDVNGPVSSTTTAIARFIDTTGKTIENSVALLSDAGALSGLTQLNVDNIQLDGDTISTTDTNGNLLLAPNGTGIVSASSTLHSDVALELKQTSAGANAITLQAPSSLAGSFTLTLPTAQAAVTGYVLSSTTAGITSWISNAALTSTTVTTTWVGIWGSGQSGDITAITDGTLAVLKIPAVSATATTAAVATNTGSPLPSQLRPVTQQELPISAVIDNANARLCGSVVISTSGIITVSLSNAGIAHIQNGGVFTGSGASGWGAFSVPYVLT